MDIKMIVTDLDRTLLRADKTITGYSVRTLLACQQRGIKVVFATARPKNRIDILPFITLADAVVVSNGSAIYRKDECIGRFGIPESMAKSTVQMIHDSFSDLRLSIEYDNITYRDRPVDDGLWEGEVRIGFDNLPALPADKIVVRAGENEYPLVKTLLPEDCYGQLCENRLILIMHKSAVKWNAVAFLAGHFGISTADIAAFGDDYNDIEMLQNCGVGVAVANGLEEVKAAADFICDTNDNDGVAKWLEENVL